jgi:hypothetical protein
MSCVSEFPVGSAMGIMHNKRYGRRSYTAEPENVVSIIFMGQYVV